jgi:two-component system, NarL family, response regulator LiaR
MAKLTPKEKEALDLLAEGLLYKEIAPKMGISLGNLKQKVHSVYKKLGASNRTEALNKSQDTNKG